jgi:DNA-binding transcriptional LysR family regulator
LEPEACPARHASVCRWILDAAEAVKITPRMWSNSGDTCCAAARGGVGVILKPQFLVADDLARGALVALLPNLPGSRKRCGATWRKPRSSCRTPRLKVPRRAGMRDGWSFNPFPINQP